MISSLDAQPHATESRMAIVPGPFETLGVELRPSARRAADRETPLFSLLRLTVGLPPDDGRWWPEAGDFAPPSLTLLERLLVGLRAWETTAVVTVVHPPGRHRRVAS